MTTLSIAVDEEVLKAAEKAAAQANTDVPSLVRDYLDRVAHQDPFATPASEAASRKNLLDLLSDCSISLDGRPTRESFYTDHRFH